MNHNRMDKKTLSGSANETAFISIIMSDQEAFLALFQTHLDDDALCMIFAAWSYEHSEQDCSEFIRGQ